ncbi:MAG: hypothetical protein AAFV32_09125 [Myxococcota bacterium]
MSGLLEFKGGSAQFGRGFGCCVVVWAFSACSDSNSSATESLTAAVAGACDAGAVEQCDGIDNDCDDAVDEGFLDNDSDGLADCVDPDDDNDDEPDATDPCPLIANTSDCGGDADRDGIPDGEESLIARFDPNLGGPGTPELCDGRDNDGDNLIDEDTGCAVCE